MKSNKPLTLIIVDDDYDDRELLKFLFNQNEKFELIGCFDSGEDVLEEIINKKNIPDILLLDMYMPIMTGIDVVMKLEYSAVAPEMNIFIISTIINIIEQDKLLHNPYITFLKKPVSLVEINDLPGLILESLHMENNTKI
ncbi:response regulator [Flavobacterium sp.]|uniref:response regulator n=1 Tax=Flavobacterium sp. TaxID=239 RepID=UPI0037527719